MARASDWSPVGMDSDPTPGDPEEVRELAEELQAFSDDVAEALGKIRGLASDRAVLEWAGLSAEAFRDEFDGVPGNLEKLRDSYDLCAQALNAYWPTLQTAQGQADRALDRAIAAQADLTAAQSALGDAQGWVSRAGEEAERLQREGERSDAEPPDEADVRAATRDRQAANQARDAAQARVDSAQESLDAARELARQAKEMREEAARQAARDIDEASDAGIHNRRWWEDAVHWVTENWDTIVDVCKVVVAVLGVVVMIIGGPLAWVVLAAALIVLTDTLIKYARGEAGLLDVAFAALDCIPGMKGLTTLGGLARGARSLATTGLRGAALGARGLGRAARGAGRGMRGLFSRADPIDMATGQLLISATDTALPGLLPLVLERHHRTSVRSGRLFGPSWSSTLDQRLVLDGHGVRLCAEDGMLLHYPRPLPDEPVLPVEGPRWPLSWHQDEDGRMTVHQPETGRTLHFAPVPTRRGAELPLIAITDRNDHRIRVAYDPATGSPTDVVHEAGYHIGVATENGRVTGLRLLSAPGRPLLRGFAYDERGNLTEVRNASGLPLTFSYDGRRRVTGWRDRNGTSYRYRYDAAGRCVGTEGSGGYLDSTIAYDDDARVTRFIDSLGATTTYRFDDAYRLIEETDPLGHTIRRTYDRYDRQLSQTDPLGATTTMTYDTDGVLTGVTRPDGRRITVENNALGQQTAVTEADGSVWRQEFDARGNLLAVTDPAGATTRFTYDDRGRVTSSTDPLGAVTRFATDAAGLVLRVTDPLGRTVAHERDAFGRTVTVTDPLGGVHRTEWTPDGAPLRSVDPKGATESWTWDAEGNCLSHTDPDGRTVRYTYGPFDLTLTETRPGGERITFAYDTELRMRRVTNPAGLTWTYERDATGLVTSETDFDGRTVRYTHDAAGRLSTRTDALGRTVSHVRDVNGMVVATDAAGLRTAFTLDPLGRVLVAEGPDARVEYARDSTGRVIAETVNGATVRHTYDHAGRPLSRVTPAGHRTAYGYDAAGARTRVECAGRLIVLERDAAGREIRRTTGHGGAALAREWDAAGLVTAQSVTAGGHELLHRAYSYLPGRHLAGVEDSRRGAVALDHDGEGRVTAVAGPGWSETYAYDVTGDQARAGWSGAGAPAPEAAGERVREGMRLTRAGGVGYRHDAAGRVVSRSVMSPGGQAEEWRYTWDAEDRLTGVVTPAGTRWRYLYDPFGRRIAKQRLDRDGAVVERTDFVWAGPQLVEQATTRADRAGRTVLTWDHDGLRPVAQTRRDTACPGTADQDTEIRFFAVVTDLIGMPTELVGEDGGIAWSLRTTVWGLGVPAGAAEEMPLRFPGQYADPETGWYYNLHRHYDPAVARYTSPDPLGLSPAPHPYAYVPHPQELSDPIGLAPYRATPYRPRMPWGRPDGQLVFSGHGALRLFQFRRSVVVPEGTSIAFYGPHGRSVTDTMGNAVELGRPVAVVDDAGQFLYLENPIPVRVYGPGQRVPNYTLFPPDGLRIMGDPFTVQSPLRLNDLLMPNLGQVHWAACSNRTL